MEYIEKWMRTQSSSTGPPRLFWCYSTMYTYISFTFPHHSAWETGSLEGPSTVFQGNISLWAKHETTDTQDAKCVRSFAGNNQIHSGSIKLLRAKHGQICRCKFSKWMHKACIVSREEIEGCQGLQALMQAKEGSWFHSAAWDNLVRTLRWLSKYSYEEHNLSLTTSEQA